MNNRVFEILPLVRKPIRYLGGEYNLVLKEANKNTVAFCLVMPEVYEIGMSNYGLKVIYSVLNRQKDVFCERSFAPWIDFGQKLKTERIPLYSLETKKPLKDFNIIGFSLQSELSYTNLLYVLDLAQIPFKNTERTEKEPLIIAGGPCTVNPLPLKDFVDCFVIGDGEEVVLEIVEVYQKEQRESREQLLKSLAKIPGVYVPLVNNGELPIKKRTVSSLKEEDFPFPPLVPISEVVHDRLTIEIQRGCIRGCRFCQAGFLNRPVRLRSPEDILRLAERGIRTTGWEEVSLLSLSAADYPNLLDLIRRLNRILKKKMVAISLPSMRGEDFSLELACELKAIRKTGLTFAPETTSPALKRMVNKIIPEENTIKTIESALETGFLGVKLYFMIGLPGETQDDIVGLADFVETVGKMMKNRSLRFHLAPFIPKPHTPLQWAGFESLDSLLEKFSYLKDRFTRHRNIRLKWENPKSGWIQAVLAQGDEKLCDVLYSVYEKGGIFQEWSEFFNFSYWEDAFLKTRTNPQDYLKPKDPNQNLAWDFIDVGIKKEFIRQEYKRALANENSDDCFLRNCADCKSCVEGSSEKTAALLTNNVGKEYESRMRPEILSTESDFLKHRHPFSQMETRFRVKYAILENFRFASHLDIARAIYRALRRSELPLVYTKGFSPKPALSFGPPRPVGITSQGEYFDLKLSGQYLGNLVRDFAPFLPEGLLLLEAREIKNSVESLQEAINIGKYQIEIRDDSSLSLNPQRLNEIPGLFRFEVIGDNPQRYVLELGSKIKLYETLSHIFGFSDTQVRSLTIVERLDSYIKKDDKLYSPFEVC